MHHLGRLLPATPPAPLRAAGGWAGLRLSTVPRQVPMIPLACQPPWSRPPGHESLRCGKKRLLRAGLGQPATAVVHATTRHLLLKTGDPDEPGFVLGQVLDVGLPRVDVRDQIVVQCDLLGQARPGAGCSHQSLTLTVESAISICPQVAFASPLTRTAVQLSPPSMGEDAKFRGPSGSEVEGHRLQLRSAPAPGVEPDLALASDVRAGDHVVVRDQKVVAGQEPRPDASGVSKSVTMNCRDSSRFPKS